MNLTRKITEEKKTANNIICWWHNWCDDDCEPDVFILKSICALEIEALSWLFFNVLAALILLLLW